MVIYPCQCHVNLEVVKKIKVIERAFYLEPKEPTSCPVCFDPMAGYGNDLPKRNEVQVFFDLIGTSGIQLAIPKERKIPWQGPIPPYPGLRGDFKYVPARSLGQLYLTSSIGLVYRVIFACTPEDCYLHIGYSYSKEFYSYLLANHFEISDRDRMGGRLLVYEPADMKRLFEIILAHNNFPQDQAEKILAEINTMKVAKIPKPARG